MKPFKGKLLQKSILLVALALAMAIAQAQPASLTGPQGTLTLNARGLSLAPSSADCPAIAAQGGPLWKMVLMTPATPPKKGETWIVSSANQKPRQEADGDAIRLVYDKVTDGKKTWKIGLTIEIRQQGDSVQIGGELRNNEKSLLVRELNCPLLGGIQAGASKAVLLYPQGLGQRFIPGDKPAEFSWNGTMQWCTFAGERGGLYVGSHDTTHGAKSFALKYTPQGRQFNLRVMHLIFLHPGGRWTLPPLVIRPYSGSWHAAAKIYRAWYDAATSRPQAPEWAKNASGWLLCILRQQNGELMWDYPSLSKLCDIADARGLDILGLFGWTAAGHDHLYPEYIVDPKMGGPEGLRKVLAEVHRRGKRAIIYANGQLIARGTEYWRTQGKDETIIKANGEYLLGVYRKYKTFPAQEFGIACHYAKGWEATMLAQAMQAHELGADGILYDQLGYGGSRTCYATHHGHLSPASVYTEDRRGMLRRIAEHMRKIDPNFILMTEGLNDLLLDSISIFHGCVNGVWTITPAEILSRIQQTKPSATFPEMFRYTFPEVMTTIRHRPPMMDRAMANYTCVYGMRNEIETRYAPDVRYLKEDVVPTRQDYRDILSPPNVEMMQATPPAEATHYLKQVIDFTRAHAELFWRGRFVDDEGFKFEGEKMMAKGYAADGRLGVVVWNPTDQAASFKLEVPGANLVSASEPERIKAEALGALAPQSIRLLVWQTENK